MKTFSTYLEEKSFAKKTVLLHQKATAHFEKYLKERNIPPSFLLYEHILEYIQYQQESGYSKRSINMKLGSVRHLLDHWVEEGVLPYNVAADVVVRGEKRSIPQGLLSEKQLDKLYLAYPSNTKSRIRNKVLFGMLIFQAVREKELPFLTVESVDLKNQTVLIPGTKRANSRTLLLHPLQQQYLEMYLNDVRYQLLNGRASDRLFVTGKTDEISFILNKIQLEVRSRKLLSSWSVLRASTITRWLKEHHLRQVQYMSGHKYISSTERYLQVDLEDIQAAIQKHHPLS